MAEYGPKLDHGNEDDEQRLSSCSPEANNVNDSNTKGVLVNNCNGQSTKNGGPHHIKTRNNNTVKLVYSSTSSGGLHVSSGATADQRKGSSRNNSMSSFVVNKQHKNMKRKKSPSSRHSIQM